MRAARRLTRGACAMQCRSPSPVRKTNVACCLATRHSEGYRIAASRRYGQMDRVRGRAEQADMGGAEVRAYEERAGGAVSLGLRVPACSVGPEGTEGTE